MFRNSIHKVVQVRDQISAMSNSSTSSSRIVVVLLVAEAIVVVVMVVVETHSKNITYSLRFILCLCDNRL